MVRHPAAAKRTASGWARLPAPAARWRAVSIRRRPVFLVPQRANQQCPRAAESMGSEFFYFYIIFFDLSKIYTEFFFINLSPCSQFVWDGSSLPPNELAVGGTAGFGTAIAVLYPCAGPIIFRRLNWR